MNNRITNILVVDDDPVMRLLAHEILSRTGSQCERQTTVKRRPDSLPQPALISSCWM